MKIVCRLLCVLALAAPALAAHAATRTILVYGDSLSAEYGLARGTGWAALLEKRLRELRADYSVVNASISGETTAGGASRITAELTRVRPAIVIIELGGNDGLRGLALTATRANLDTMIRAARHAGARVVLCGMQLPPNYGRDYAERFRNLYTDLAATHKIALVPFFLEGVGERRDLFQADGIHPTEAAQARILDNVWAMLAPLTRTAKR
ncbi:MAG: arylesterase [Burkholderiales bacterium]